MARQTTKSRKKGNGETGRKGTARGKSKSHKKGADRRWSARVKTVSTFPPEGVFKKDAETIARVMSTKKVSPRGIGSGIRMIQFFINRAGKTLPATRNRELEKAKKIMRSHRQEDRKT